MDPKTDTVYKAISFIFYFIEWFIGWLILFIILIILAVPRKDKGILTEHKISLSENGITEITAVNRSESSWNGISNVVQTKCFIFIYTSKRASHVIPKRAFPSKEDSDNFFQYALNQWQKAQNNN